MEFSNLDQHYRRSITIHLVSLDSNYQLALRNFFIHFQQYEPVALLTEESAEPTRIPIQYRSLARDDTKDRSALPTTSTLSILRPSSLRAIMSTKKRYPTSGRGNSGWTQWPGRIFARNRSRRLCAGAARGRSRLRTHNGEYRRRREDWIDRGRRETWFGAFVGSSILASTPGLGALERVRLGGFRLIDFGVGLWDSHSRRQ